MHRKNTLFRIAFIGACSLLLWVFWRGDTSANAAEKIPNAVNIEVDKIWGGTGLLYKGVSAGPIVYLAYFNAERQLTVARIDTKTGEVRKKHLASIFKGWDAHNYIVLNYDKDSFLHVSGNMHASPLVYARTLRPGDFDSLTLMNKMVGRDEDSTTYPQFLNFPDGSLGFSFRSGTSGNGIELINKFENRRWVRILSQPLFAPDPSGEKVNAYHTGYILRPDGYYHVAWVWRMSPNADFNFNVNYARSKDLKHWEDSQGNKIDLPITPSRSEVVDAIPVNGGLLNTIKLGFDLKGVPVISYLKYDKEGNSQLYHARLEGDRWKIIQATNWKYHWRLNRGGTFVKDISFSGVRVDHGNLYEDVFHIMDGSNIFVYDPATMKKIDVRPPTRNITNIANISSSMTDASLSPFKLMTQRIYPKDQESFKGYIQWKSLGVDNNDRPRTCESIHQEEGCSMSSTLYLRSLQKEPPSGAASK